MPTTMTKPQRWPIDRWTVDFGDGPEQCRVPHAWRQDLDVRSEGPVIYRVTLKLPSQPAHLVFHGVSYACSISIDGEEVFEHRGIWDAFEVPLERWQGQTVDLGVFVVKNGGPTYPVRETAAGFLPFVFHTFGGIFREVELVLDTARRPLEPAAPASRVRVDGSEILVDGQPFELRGLLHWGWYPELGHPNPGEDTIRQEIRAVKRLGFNTIKFCLWLPPHRYLRALEDEGMFAWLELPLWDPAPDAAVQDRLAVELEVISRQYRCHSNAIVWTAGCELGSTVFADMRERLANMLRNVTGCPLVRDSSGGAEMYGGDLRESADFDDFHPYFELPQLPSLMAQFAPGPRVVRPILLGETADCDVHRNLGKLHDQLPYWASSSVELNDPGVRWTHPLPKIVAESRFVADHEASERLRASSESKAAFVRKYAIESIRSSVDGSGFVLTGIRDTPISTSGLFRDDGSCRVEFEEARRWNGDACIFLIPFRQPTWIRGGNRAGWAEPYCQFEGDLYFRVGLRSPIDSGNGWSWRLESTTGDVVASGHEPPASIRANRPGELGIISVRAVAPGNYALVVESGRSSNLWLITVVAQLDASEGRGLTVVDPSRRFGPIEASGGDLVLASRLGPEELSRWEHGSNVIAFIDSDWIEPMPFWRESGFEWPSKWDSDNLWHLFLSITPDCAIRPPVPWAEEVLLNRIDVRSYSEHAIVTRAVRDAGGKLIVTTLRPEGGVGTNSPGIARNPAGVWLLRAMRGLIE